MATVGTGNNGLVKPKVQVEVEVTETVIYQLPLDVVDPDDQDSIRTAWLTMDQEAIEEFRVTSMSEFRVLSDPTEAMIEEALLRVKELGDTLHEVLLSRKRRFG